MQKYSPSSSFVTAEKYKSPTSVKEKKKSEYKNIVYFLITDLICSFYGKS